MEGLKNIMEDAVEEHINQILPTMPNVCTCKKCQLDIATYALNRLPAQYVRTDAGALYKKLNNHLPQSEATIVTEITKAIEIIASNPNHESVKPQ
ncbi:MAG: late competence development ComFB family protein [Clostridium sp.]|nr:late competence development ComFB family protein [Clostridium sp.]MCM1172383.1 late competence development ComFB family protein [Clostridium sp.]MCM1207777.1 late competence development ComFB family protein [Ruminococcus sp.]